MTDYEEDMLDYYEMMAALMRDIEAGLEKRVVIIAQEEE
jgi:hypothetical protein